MRFSDRVLVAGTMLVALAACGDDSSVEGVCATADDCTEGVCVDSRCVVTDRDGGVNGSDAGSEALDSGSDAADGGEADAGCSTMLFCGDPPVCCGDGTECIQGSCLTTCDTGVRCGDACCGEASDVCIDGECVAPGDECADNFDCPPGGFCEPTLSRCLPQFDPVTCETEPVFGAFEVTEELALTDSETRSDCFQPISTPLVVDLNGDDVPELVSNMACDANWTRGVLRAFRGDTGEELWTSEVELNGRVSIAAGDLRGDGQIVIVGEAASGEAIAFDAAGAVLWRSAESIASGNGAPALADLDGDGRAEIVWGAQAFDADGVLLWRSDAGAREGTNSGYTGGLSAVADIDGDGLVDVVSGRRAYERDGTLKWFAETIPDGYPALADFDGDGLAEVVLVASGNVYVLDGVDGAVEWGPVALPGGGRGGPPTVADFDRDGMPEVGVAGGGSYSVFDPTGETEVLWSRPTVDESSNATGSSVFDFEGDGGAEVVYQDECHVWVYSGLDGSVLFSVESTSATIHEYPIVVDVDGDGNSELVTVANNRVTPAGCGAGFAGARKGIFVYGDARDQWVRTRRVWNQHAYSVTNVGSGGEIPSAPALNWRIAGLNNFRQNVQGEGVFNAPDLQVGLEVRLDGCPGRATLRARVVNDGNLGAASGVAVVFYEGATGGGGAEIARSTTTMPLLPGASEVVEVIVDLPAEGAIDFHVVADGATAPDGDVIECREDNNTGELLAVECELLI